MNKTLKDLLIKDNTFEKVLELMNTLSNCDKITKTGGRVGNGIEISRFSINEQKILKVLLRNNIICSKNYEYRLNYTNPITTTLLTLNSLLDENQDEPIEFEEIPQRVENKYNVTYTVPHRHEFLRTDRPDPVADRKKRMNEMITKYIKE